jgi:hypothetical protein
VHQASETTAYARIFDSPFPLDESLRKWAEHTGQAWLARRSQTLLGFATATGSEVDGLYVLPKEAGRGFGRPRTARVSQTEPVSGRCRCPCR